jgi:hypothetical protein
LPSKHEALNYTPSTTKHFKRLPTQSIGEELEALELTYYVRVRVQRSTNTLENNFKLSYEAKDTPYDPDICYLSNSKTNKDI